VTWKTRLAAGAFGLVAAVIALLVADPAGQATGVAVLVAIPLGFLAVFLALAWVRRRVRAGWRPTSPPFSIAAGSAVGMSFGLLLAWFGPPEIAAPLVGLGSGIFLGAAVSPVVTAE
jgi:hypothetical protein